MLLSEGAITYSDYDTMDYDEVVWFLKELGAHHERLKNKFKTGSRRKK